MPVARSAQWTEYRSRNSQIAGWIRAPNSARAARLHYLPNGYRMLVAGDHVVCAESGEAIPLDELRYWSVERQEAYASPEAVLKRLHPQAAK